MAANGFSETDLDRMPEDNGHRYEIIDGSLHVTPPATDDHNESYIDVCFVLRAAAPRGYRALTELGVRCGDSRLIPDVVVLRPGAARGVHWRGAADVALVVEVESPSTRDFDRLIKSKKYAEAGIPAYWRVEPTGDGPRVHVYELDEDGKAYAHVTTVEPDGSWRAEVPYPVTIEPATWSGR